MAQTVRLCVDGIDRGLDFRHQVDEALNSAGDCAAVPGVERPAGVEDEWILVVRELRRGSALTNRRQAPLATGQRKGFDVQDWCTRVVLRGTGPLDTAFRIEPVVIDACQDRGQAGHLLEDVL